MNNALAAYLPAGRKAGKAKMVESFQFGFVYKINERMREEKAARAPIVPNSASSALVVLKGHLVAEALAALNLKFKTARRSSRSHDIASMAAGRSAGACASLGGDRSISSGPMRIGCAS